MVFPLRNEFWISTENCTQWSHQKALALIIKAHILWLSPFLGTINFAHAQNQFDRSDHTRPRSIKALSHADSGQRGLFYLNCNATASSSTMCLLLLAVGDQERRLSLCVMQHTNIFTFFLPSNDLITCPLDSIEINYYYFTTHLAVNHTSLSHSACTVLFIEPGQARTQHLYCARSLTPLPSSSARCTIRHISAAINGNYTKGIASYTLAEPNFCGSDQKQDRETSSLFAKLHARRMMWVTWLLLWYYQLFILFWAALRCFGAHAIWFLLFATRKYYEVRIVYIDRYFFCCLAILQTPIVRLI